MNPRDRETTTSDEVLELLFLEADGELGATEQARLERAVAGDPELARLRQELSRLDPLLVEHRLEPRAGFKQSVMTNLRPAGWEARHPSTWRFAVALLVVLAGSAAALVGIGSARMSRDGAFLGALGAVADLFQSAALAGAGLLSASWRGLGLTLGQAVESSRLTLAALVLAVVCANGLFWMLRRGMRRAAAQAGRAPKP